ncbi:hypothetical protein Ahy_A01g002491 [Arachis hypogaea]|uniref:Uncharacterized protein n=1 Tax=Arachis hypogaea TaxID=3818 RepID=A0A445ER57_ARAHY|nr:hypothetical protein Ahy_A01g002491 [Arachis hypogaea]
MSYDFDVALDDFESQVRYVYPRTGDGLLDFLVQQKIKDQDVSLCPRCNAIFNAEAAGIFEKERMKKDLAHREEQASQRQPIRRVKGSSSKNPQHDVTTPLSRSQAIGLIICIDATLNGDTEHCLRISMLLIKGELEDSQEKEVEEEVLIRIRNFKLMQEKKQARR